MPSLKTEQYSKTLERVDFDVVSQPEQWRFLEMQCAEILDKGVPVGVDTETTGLSALSNQVRLIQIAADGYALIVDLDGWREGDSRFVDWSRPGLSALRMLLESDLPKILQNAAFDLNMLRGEGIYLGGFIFDVMIAAKIINNGTGSKNDLGSLVKRVLKVDMPKELQKSNWSVSPLTKEQLTYAARDAGCLPMLMKELAFSLVESRTSKTTTLWDIFKIESAAIRPIALMQWHGFNFNKNAALELREKLKNEEARLLADFIVVLDDAIAAFTDDPTKRIPRNEDGTFNTNPKTIGSIRLGTKIYAGFNAKSPGQMAVKFECAGICLPPDENGKPSLDQNLLSFIKDEYPLVKQYLVWKKSATLVSHIEKLLKSIGADGRIHCSYNQMGTETSRLSASGPNLQQIPRERMFRELFTAPPGRTLIVADFSQIELRVAAELSQDERMLEAYRQGRDLHTETGAAIAGVDPSEVTKAARNSAKIVNFGLIYGAGPSTLRKQAQAQYDVAMTLTEAKKFVNLFRSTYPTLHAWQQHEGTQETAAVFTKLRRRRMLVGFNDKYTVRINTQVQGTAGDIAKLAIGAIWDCICSAAPDEAKLISMVHDEIVLEVDSDHVAKWSELLKSKMEEAGAMVCSDVPILAEVSHGPTWADAK